MVSFSQTVKTAARALKKNKTRSLLTVIGIVIGIGAITLVMSIGKGIEAYIVGQLGAFGAETLVIRPGKEPKGLSDFAELIFADSLKERDLNLLKRKSNVPNIEDLSPEVFVTGSVSAGRETFKPFIVGFSAEFVINTLDLELASGEAFDEADISNRSFKALIGSKVKKELFGESDAIGESITIRGRKFKVVGVFEPRGQVVFFNVDELVVIPYSTALKYLLGRDYYTQIVVRADDPANVDKVSSDIKMTLREAHRIDDPSEDDFYIQTQQGGVEQISSIIGIFTTFLSLVVAVSLVVGGIVVMNIMLVSVTERTREIGLRKAVGATNGDILKQFLVESVMLSIVGGVLGVVLGSGVSFTISFILNQTGSFSLPFIFPVGGAIIGFVVSAVVGIVFGIYPARQAAKKSPIEALRYE